MAAMIGIPEKEIKKVNKELLELHKKVLLNYLLTRSIKLRIRRKFFKLYDWYVNTKNIHEYFFAPISIFVQCLVKDELWRCRKYHKEEKKKRRKRK